jgi:type IV pilus assembly protein PilW
LVITLGNRPYLRYGIDQGRLMQAEQLKYVQGGSTYVDDDRLMDDIVFIAAQYGIDTDCAGTSLGGCVSSAGAAGNQSVDRFVEPAGVWAETALTPARFGRIKAIRLAVVARNSQYIKNDATCSENPVTVSPMDLWTKINAGDDAPPQFTVPVGGDGCQHYRYRVFETVVPLRNMIWGQL